MMELMPDGMLVPDSDFDSYVEQPDSVLVNFKNGTQVEADILVGADGIRSGVSKQAFGDLGLFHVGLRAWLAWCDPLKAFLPTPAESFTRESTKPAFSDAARRQARL